MNVFSKIRGTIETLFSLGIGGPNLKNNGGVVEARNAGDLAFVVVRGATPVADNDLVTKAYADTLSKPIVVTAQWDGNVALPANTGTEHFYVVTTSGGFANVGDLLWDDGSGAGTVVVLPAINGRSIFTAAAFAGGTISLVAQAYYVWDTAGSVWLLETSAAIAGAVREIRYTITELGGGAQDSATPIPATARIVTTQYEVTVPFATGTVTITNVAATRTLQTTTDNNPEGTAGDIYAVDQDTDWPVASAVRTTVAGGTGAGTGVTIVRYTVPNP